MKILLAIDGSPYTKKMLAYLTTHDDLFSTQHDYTLLSACMPLPGNANLVISKQAMANYHREVAEKALSPKTILRFPLVLPEPDSGLRRDFDRRCRDANVLDRLKVAVEVGPPSTALDYVRDGIGIGVVPRSATVGEGGMVIKPLPPKLSLANTIRVICRKRAGTDELDLSDGAADFLAALRKASGEMR